MAASGSSGLEALRIEPLSARQTVQEVVYQRLRLALMAGQFDPGQALTISFLAELFGTSHMPVREALRRLTAENALETTTTGSTKVPVATRARLDDICDARTLVESAATARAAAGTDAAFLRALEHNLGEHVSAGRDGRIPAMLQRNQEFHFLIYRASGSEALVHLIESLWLRFGPYLRMLSEHLERHGGHEDDYTRHHRRIIDALSARDAQAASRHMEEDIRATQHLLQGLSEL